MERKEGKKKQGEEKKMKEEVDEVKGVRVDMVSSDRVEGMNTAEKVRFILDGVRQGKVVILESGLTPEEESRLIETTMMEINPDEFSGIEIESYPKHSDSGILKKLFSSDTSLTIVGPANRVETLHKDEDLISTLFSP